MEQLAKNQLHTAEITGYTSDGAGVCHIAGRAVFVKGALAGETWQVRILKVTANAVYGKAEQCLSPVPARTQPPCPVYRTCGGCSLQHMDYDEQLRMKLQRVNDALTRIGGVSTPVQDIIGMEYPLCYRNKAIYAVGAKDGRVVKGFYRASSHDITPVEQCLLQLPLADKAAQAVCDWMDLRGVAPYDEATGRGTVRHLFTRCAMHTPDAVLCIVSARGFGAQTDGLIAYLREHCPELTGIVLDVNKQKGNVVLAGDFYPLWGVPELTDRLCGLTFTLSPQAFYQVNPVQAERLYERAVEYAVNAPTDQVLDLYCGNKDDQPVSGAKGRARHQGRDRAGGDRERAPERGAKRYRKCGVSLCRCRRRSGGAGPARRPAGLPRGRSPAQGHVPGSHRRDGVHAAAAHRLCLLRSGHARARCEAAHTARLHAHAGAGRGHVPADAAC